MSPQIGGQEVFGASAGAAAGACLQDPSKKAVPFDFRHPDRISKAQMRAIRALYETFVRNLAPNLSAHLRTYLTVELARVEQMTYTEFLQGLPSPTFLATLGLRPQDGCGVLELNPSLGFLLLEMLLGGSGGTGSELRREITEIEQSLLGGLIRILLQDLSSAWRGLTPLEFSLQSMETEPAFLRVMPPNEAVVAAGVQVRIGEICGAINVAIPSLIVKLARCGPDQQRPVRKAESAPARQGLILRLIQNAPLETEACLAGATITIHDLLALACGDILMLDCPADHPLTLRVAGVAKFEGRPVAVRNKKGFQVERIQREVDEGLAAPAVSFSGSSDGAAA